MAPAAIVFTAFFLLPLVQLFIIGAGGKDGVAAYGKIVTDMRYVTSLVVTVALSASVTFATLMWWAEHGQGTSALEATRAVFRALALADEPDAPASPPATG